MADLPTLSNVAEDLVKKHTRELVPDLVRDMAFSMKEDIIAEFMSRFDGGEMYNEVAHRMQRSAHYFGGSAHVGRIDSTGVDFLQAGEGAVPRTGQEKMRESVSVLDFGAVGDGVTDNVASWQAAMTALGVLGGGTLVVPYGTYLFTVTGDSETILIPSNVEVVCEPGVILKWGYWGSPLIAIVNKSNVRWKGGKFVWTGTFGTGGALTDKFSYGRSVPAYEYCAHIICYGSDDCEFDDIECAADTSSNIQNIFISVNGKNDAATQSSGLRISNLRINDVCQGIVGDLQKQFTIENIHSDRYSNVSDDLYGPGHVIYATGGWIDGQVSHCYDTATPIIAPTVLQGAALSYQFKGINRCNISHLYSNRVDGALVFSAAASTGDSNDNTIDNLHWTADRTPYTTGLAGTAVAIIVNTTNEMSRNIFSNWFLFDQYNSGVGTSADMTIIEQAGNAYRADNAVDNVFKNINVAWTPDNAFSSPAVTLFGENSFFDFTFIDNGSQVKAIFILRGDDAARPSKNNVLTIKKTGTEQAPELFSSTNCENNTWIFESSSTAPNEGTLDATDILIRRGQVSTRSKFPTVPIGSVAYGSFGTNTTPVAGTIYWAEVFIPRPMVITGIGVLNGGTVGTDKHVVGLYKTNGGAVLANSALAGVTTSGANAFQEVALTATYSAEGPARYWVALQMNGTTDRFRSIAASTFVDVLTDSDTGSFGTLTSLTAPTTFTADVGPIAYVY